MLFHARFRPDHSNLACVSTYNRPARLRQVERALPFTHRDTKSLTENLGRRVIRELEVVDASHDTGKVVVRGVWWFAWAANDSEHGSETLET